MTSPHALTPADPHRVRLGEREFVMMMALAPALQALAMGQLRALHLDERQLDLGLPGWFSQRLPCPVGLCLQGPGGQPRELRLGPQASQLDELRGLVEVTCAQALEVWPNEQIARRQ